MRLVTRVAGVEDYGQNFFNVGNSNEGEALCPAVNSIACTTMTMTMIQLVKKKKLQNECFKHSLRYVFVCVLETDAHTSFGKLLYPVLNIKNYCFETIVVFTLRTEHASDNDK